MEGKWTHPKKLQEFTEAHTLIVSHWERIQRWKFARMTRSVMWLSSGQGHKQNFPGVAPCWFKKKKKKSLSCIKIPAWLQHEILLGSPGQIISDETGSLSVEVAVQIHRPASVLNNLLVSHKNMEYRRRLYWPFAKNGSGFWEISLSLPEFK